jgi:hypothetical protein
MKCFMCLNYRWYVYRRSGKYQPPPPAESLKGTRIHVNHIVRHPETRKHKNKRADVEYLVAWRGSSPKEHTWEPAVHLKHAAGQYVRIGTNFAHGDKSVVPGSAPY